MDAKTKTLLVIAFVSVVGLFLLFSGGMMTGTMMTGGMMGTGMMGQSSMMSGMSWMWLPTLLTVGLGVLIGWAVWGKK